jgi:MFS family permease
MSLLGDIGHFWGSKGIGHSTRPRKKMFCGQVERTRQASIIAFRGARFFLRHSCHAKYTMMMPFFLTTPASKTSPTKLKILSSCPKTLVETVSWKAQNEQISLSLGIVAAGGLLGCVAIGAMFSLPVFLRFISRDTGWSITGVSSAMTFGFLAAALGSIIWGNVLARKNFPLRMMGTIIGGTAMAGSLGMATGPLAGGLIYDSFASYGWLYIGACGIGIGASLIALTFKPYGAQPTQEPARAAA